MAAYIGSDRWESERNVELAVREIGSAMLRACLCLSVCGRVTLQRCTAQHKAEADGQTRRTSTRVSTLSHWPHSAADRGGVSVHFALQHSGLDSSQLAFKRCRPHRRCTLLTYKCCTGLLGQPP